MWNNPLLKLLSLYLVFAMFLLTLPVQSWAMFIPADRTMSVRQTDMDIIQKTLESSLIKKRLMDFGLSSEDAMVHLSRLSNEQIHQLAQNLDSLQAGADSGIGVLIFLVVVAIIVVVILEATGHRVILRK